MKHYDNEHTSSEEESSEENVNYKAPSRGKEPNDYSKNVFYTKQYDDQLIANTKKDQIEKNRMLNIANRAQMYQNESLPDYDYEHFNEDQRYEQHVVGEFINGVYTDSRYVKNEKYTQFRSEPPVQNINNWGYYGGQNYIPEDIINQPINKFETFPNTKRQRNIPPLGLNITNNQFPPYNENYLLRDIQKTFPSAEPPFSPTQQTRTKRSKINLEYISGKNKRNVTFSKRKKGIMKKAFELSTLTGSDVLLLVASESGHVYTYATPRLKPLLPKNRKFIEECLSKADNSIRFDTDSEQ